MKYSPKLFFVFICISISAIFTVYHANQNLLISDTDADTKVRLLHERCQGDERRLCVPPLNVFESRFRVNLHNI